MKTIIKTKVLADILDIATRFVSRNTTLPILENVYIKGGIDTIIFRASDMEKYVEIEIPAEIDIEGSLTINARKLSDYIKTIEDEEIKLQIDTAKNTLTIKTSNDTIKLNGIAGSEYLWLPVVTWNRTLMIDTQSLVTWISKVEFAVTEKNFSPVLTWVLMRLKTYPDSKKLVFVWTDSFRLAEYKIPYAGTEEDVTVIIPKSNVNELKKVLEYHMSIGGSMTTILIGDNLVGFDAKMDWISIKTVSLLIQWAFPDYENENIMPTIFNTTVTVDKSSLEKAIKKINILTRDTNNFISLDIQGDSINVESGEMDAGEANTVLQSVTNGEWYKVGLNGRYVTDIMKYTSSSNLNFGIVASDKPIMFTDPDDSQYRYIIRPISK